jgi:hypothetical protein
LNVDGVQIRFQKSSGVHRSADVFGPCILPTNL